MGPDLAIAAAAASPAVFHSRARGDRRRPEAAQRAVKICGSRAHGVNTIEKDAKGPFQAGNLFKLNIFRLASPTG